MCGIFGYLGKRRATGAVIEGLKKLEYRGYDSSGIAGVHEGKLFEHKEVGKVAEMESSLDEEIILDVAIAHTRWATHGIPSRENAHPHFSYDRCLAVVHNGIVENHSSLRKMLKEKKVVFTSDTDTEVIAHLLAHFYEGSLLKAMQKVMPLLEGSYSLAVIHCDHPDEMVVAAHGSPIAIGIGDGEMMVASDLNAFGAFAKKVLFLADGEAASVHVDNYKIYDSNMMEISKEVEEIAHKIEEVSKGDFEHFTLKEIFEQPGSLRAALAGRLLEEYGTIGFDDLDIDLLGAEQILILACGTSWHAGYLGAYMFEEMARIPTQIEISSEFRYKNPIIPHNCLVIAISQSGETADTLAAVRELKAKGAKVLGICNVLNSSLVREADSCIYLRAGPEIGVCSTKAFTSQVVVMAELALLLARMHHMNKADGVKFLEEMKQVPEVAQKVIDQHEKIRDLAKKYSRHENFFFLGRRYMFPCALEGALKLKEISYVNANGYPAGEMKHGPIALINADCPTVAFCGDSVTFEKMKSNLMEVKARQGKILAIAEEGSTGIEEIADDVIFVPPLCDALATIPSSIAAQLFAYYFAHERGAEIDQPRNLAKSVTVE